MMNNKKTKDLKISNRALYTLIIIIICLTLIVGVYSYGTSNPPVFGHSAGELEVDAIPSGMVLAFDLSSCPTGWSEFTSARGRTIVGLNPNDGSFNTRGETGGAKTHTLTIAEMPSHRHLDHGAPSGSLPPGSGCSVFGGGTYTDYVGGGGAHNNVQPYITYVYCRKN